MAGKRKIKPNKTQGGSRKGAGRPKQKRNYSDSLKAEVVLAAEELAAEHGISVAKSLLKLIFDSDVQDTVKASIAKWYADILVTKETEKTITHNTKSQPEIYLPKRLEDPAKVIPIDGGKGGDKTGTR